MEYKKILSIDIGITNLGMYLVECKFVPPYDKWSSVEISKLELVNIVKEIHHGKKVREGAKPKNAKTENIHVLCNALVRILLARQSWLENITDIRVEQQPLMRGRGTGSVGSSRMKVIQHCILTFYETYFAIHSHLTKPSILPSSPSNKLKCIIDVTNFAIAPMDKTDKNTDYKQRKSKAVEGFEKLITVCTINDDIKELYADKKKHDDMADCILQAVYELQTHACKLRSQEIKKQEKETKKARTTQKRKQISDLEEDAQEQSKQSKH